MNTTDAARGRLEVLRPGPLTTIQDDGRRGYGHLGVTGSGAADRGSLQVVNRLLGNVAAAAALELTLGGLRLRATGLVMVAVTGAPLPLTVIDLQGVKTSRPYGAAFVLRDGEVLDLGRPTSGLRTYLGVRGGVGAHPVLGSCSTDLLAGLGPEPLTKGSVLPVGEQEAGEVADEPPVDPDLLRTSMGAALQFKEGPRADWFTDDAVRTLVSQSWQVSPDSNRIGLKLLGAQPLTRLTNAELPSEPLMPGAIQVPPHGKPVIFLADHPVTGGYPVVGVLLADSIDRAAQLRPGLTVRFEAC